MFHSHPSSLRGFSLAEVLIAIVIITILTIGSIAVYSSQLGKARDTERGNDIARIKLNLDTIVGQYGAPPNAAPKVRKMPAACKTDTDLLGCYRELALSSVEDIDAMMTDPSQDNTIPGTSETYNYKYASNANSYVICATLENQKSAQINADSKGKKLAGASTALNNMYCEWYTAPGDTSALPDAKAIKTPTAS